MTLRVKNDQDTDLVYIDLVDRSSETKQRVVAGRYHFLALLITPVLLAPTWHSSAANT